jgi:hypothetical protein
VKKEKDQKRTINLTEDEDERPQKRPKESAIVVKDDDEKKPARKAATQGENARRASEKLALDEEEDAFLQAKVDQKADQLLRETKIKMIGWGDSAKSDITWDAKQKRNLIYVLYVDEKEHVAVERDCFVNPPPISKKFTDWEKSHPRQAYLLKMNVRETDFKLEMKCKKEGAKSPVCGGAKNSDCPEACKNILCAVV